MKRLFITSLVALLTMGISAQDNFEAFRHLGVGVEAGLHGFGIDVAMPDDRTRLHNNIPCPTRMRSLLRDPLHSL